MSDESGNRRKEEGTDQKDVKAHQKPNPEHDVPTDHAAHNAEDFTRRGLLKSGWVVPVVAAISIPAHAQVSEQLHTDASHGDTHLDSDGPHVDLHLDIPGIHGDISFPHFDTSIPGAPHGDIAGSHLDVPAAHLDTHSDQPAGHGDTHVDSN